MGRREPVLVFGQATRAVRGANAVLGADSKLAEEMLFSVSGARAGEARSAVLGADSKLAEEMLFSISGAREPVRPWTGDARRPRRRQQASGGNAIPSISSASETPAPPFA